MDIKNNPSIDSIAMLTNYLRSEAAVSRVLRGQNRLEFADPFPASLRAFGTPPDFQLSTRPSRPKSPLTEHQQKTLDVQEYEADIYYSPLCELRSNGCGMSRLAS